MKRNLRLAVAISILGSMAMGIIYFLVMHFLGLIAAIVGLYVFFRVLHWAVEILYEEIER